jgi:hypothetical protein
MPTAKTKRKKSISEFFAAVQKAETRSFYELDERTKKTLSTLISADGPKVEAWSFVPHPKVFEVLAGSGERLQRYIVTIDTQSSAVYEPVRSFLQSQRSNISAYFSGGWADFLCDIQMTSPNFNVWLEQLREVLRKANANKFCPAGNVNSLISAFLVEDQIVICGKLLEDLVTPNRADLHSLVQDRARFEMALRNYNSPETVKLFPEGVKEVQRYLNRLKREGIIVCFKIVADFARFTNCDYLPMIADRRVSPNFLQANSELLSPVKELFAVKYLQVADDTEKNVSHIFVNYYDFPGDRTRWKQSVYEAAKEATDDEVNIYSYPLEGPVNESPIYLSDVPELLHKALQYAGKGLELGTATHPMLQGAGPSIRLPSIGLSRHGVVFGEANSGKTNSDLIIAREALKLFENVVIFDDSGGIASKLDGATNATIANPHRLSITLANKPEDLTAIVSEIFNKKGFQLVQIEKEIYPNVVETWCRLLANLPDQTRSNKPREIRNLLLLEEAGDLFLEENSTISRALASTLDQAFRKGWSVWLSLQRPSQFGKDAQKFLRNLVNKVIYRLRDKSEVNSIIEALGDAGLGTSELAAFEAAHDGLPKFSAVVIGTTVEAGNDRILPPILTKFSLFNTTPP